MFNDRILIANRIILIWNLALNNIFMRLIFLLFLPIIVFGQRSESESTTYTWFDNTIGISNTDIFNGLVYVEKHKMINEKHKFYNNPNFSLGSIIFNAQPYYNINLKYDVFNDELLLVNDAPNLPTILLDKDKIIKFSIGNSVFENLKIETKKGEILTGFFEVLSRSEELELYKKNHKKLQTKTNDKIRYFEFKDQNRYVFFYQGIYYQINKLNDLSKTFPNYKDLIKQKEQEYKNLRKENVDAYLKFIFEDLSRVMIKSSSGI